MKKSKLLILGLIAMLLVGGLALAGCDEYKKCQEGEKDCIHTSSLNILHGKKYSSCGYSLCAVVLSAGDDVYQVLCNCK